ncbi:unnamed protein product [Ectocarpus sp. CCAP 1310/34]|nr:unnamed protein product [Ectocarpus sp. CCAP 1310/34]
MLDPAREGGGVVKQDQMLQMVGSIGAYSMANATGGTKHANKAAVDPFYDADAHGVDLPVSIHQGVHPENLEKGTAGIIDYFKKKLLSKWLKSTELLVVCYDRQELVPAIQGHEQLGMTEKLEECSRTFDPKSTNPVPSLQYGSWLRTDVKAARDGIATNLVMRVLADDVWTADTKPNGIVAFYGVGGEPSLSADNPAGVDADVGLGMGVGTTEALAETVPLLHFRDGTDPISDVERHRGPDIGEAELSVIHFIARAMKVFASICELQDGSGSAWPPVTFRSWDPTDADKVRLFIQTFLESGCDYLPAISGLPFDKMWVLVLKSMRTEGLFDKPLFFEEQDGTWAMDVDECAKQLATMFFYKDEAAFGSAHLSPAQLLESVDGDVEDYVSLVRYDILQLPKKKTTATCPSSFALCKQAERGNAIFRYWQNGLREAMPTTEFAYEGWGVDPRGKGSDSDELIAENCVLWLSEYSYIGPNRKTVTLACGCNPDTALCNRCRCKDRKCSLACGRISRCTLRRAAPAHVRAGGRSASRPTVGTFQTGPIEGPIEGVARPQLPIDTRPQPSLRVANSIALLVASMKQK